jgi:hypothetical protein
MFPKYTSSSSSSSSSFSSSSSSSFFCIVHKDLQVLKLGHIICRKNLCMF